jgi:hypothetical protein
VKQQNPAMGNTDVSRLLGEMWRNASEEEKKPYVEQEEHERAAYKEEVKRFREKQAQFDAANRTTHHSAVQNIRQRDHHRGNHHQHQTIPGFEPSTASTSQYHVTFENSNLDQISEDVTQNPTFPPDSSHPYHRTFYRPVDHFQVESYPQATWSALSMDESDPLPVVPPGYPPVPKANNDEINGSFYPARQNNYFSDRPFDFNLCDYNRYP